MGQKSPPPAPAQRPRPIKQTRNTRATVEEFDREQMGLAAKE